MLNLSIFSDIYRWTGAHKTFELRIPKDVMVNCIVFFNHNLFHSFVKNYQSASIGPTTTRSLCVQWRNLTLTDNTHTIHSADLEAVVSQIKILSPPSHWQKSVATFGLGSSSQQCMKNNNQICLQLCRYKSATPVSCCAPEQRDHMLELKVTKFSNNCQKRNLSVRLLKIDKLQSSPKSCQIFGLLL